MKNILKYLMVALSFLMMNGIYGQDTIKKKNGEVLKVVVKEINDSQIKYYHFDDPNQVLFTVDRAVVSDIKFSYGAEYKEKEPLMTDDYFTEDASMALKLSMSSMLWDAAILSFDKAIDAKSGIQVSAKLFGIGFGPSANDFENNSGFGIELGYRLKFGGLKKKKWEYRPNHLLEGGYVMPTIGYNQRKRTYDSSFNSYEINNKLVHLGLNFGKQKVIQNTLILDYYAGFAYFGGSSNEKFDGVDRPRENDELFAGDIFGGNNFGITLGFKVGFAFGKYGDQVQRSASDPSDI